MQVLAITDRLDTLAPPTGSGVVACEAFMKKTAEMGSLGTCRGGAGRHVVAGWLVGATLATLASAVGGCGSSGVSGASLTGAAVDASGGSADARRDGSEGSAANLASQDAAGPSPDAGLAAPEGSGEGGSAVVDASDASKTTVTPGSPGQCGLDYQACFDGNCCSGIPCDTSINACGGCFDQGVRCSVDAGDAGSCCNGLACVNGFCGTNACVPDGTPCGGGAGVVCCNDNCNGSTCGGL
jgi:hypothetical protein